MDRKMKIRTAIVPNTNCRYVAYEDGRVFDKKRNLFVSQSISKRGNRVSVKCIETGLIYETIKDASIALGIDCSHISACCQKKYGFKSVHGFHFEYYPLRVEDIEKVDESS